MPQPKLHWTAHLWPGLPQLWMRGSWAGLALAVGFSVLANLLLASSLVWTEWLPVRVRWIGLATLGFIWIAAWFEGRADWRRFVAEWTGGQAATDCGVDVTDQWFREAQKAYLAGDWVAAEKRLLQLVRLDPRDAEARLMLATLWRHENRLEDARRELDRLSSYESAAPWRDEITRERKQLEPANVLDSEAGEDAGEKEEEAAWVEPAPVVETAEKTAESEPENHALGERQDTSADTIRRLAA